MIRSPGRGWQSYATSGSASVEILPGCERFADAEGALHAAASEATGLSDFGGDEYLEGLRVLLRAYDEEAAFCELGRLGAASTLIGCLKARLLSRAGWKQRPECLKQSIERPVFIVGLPRTGTTLLHRLLACDPETQALPYWLGASPMPRPPRAAWGASASYREAEAYLAAVYQANPRLKAIHEMAAGEVDECRLLLMQSFANVTFSANATIASYDRWLLTHDMSQVYRHYRDNLRLVGTNAPEKRWILKDASHMWALDSLFEHFPDAWVVQTRRDPVKLIPSVCSLVYEVRRLAEPEVSPALVGAQQLEQWLAVMKRTRDTRRRRGGRGFIDIEFDALAADPLAVVRRIYQELGLELGVAAEREMRRWLGANPQGKHGAHRYRAEDFGLSEATIQERFEHQAELPQAASPTAAG